MKNIMCGVVAAMMAAAAHAQETARWGQAGHWTVMVDRTLNNGCFAITAYDGGAVLRVGYSPVDGSAYIVIANDQWGSLEVGKDYELEMQFDSREPWSGSATVITAEGFERSLSVKVNGDLLQEFAKSHVFVVRYMGKEIARLSLRGSRVALMEVFKCQAVIASSGSSSTDPFNAAPQDPFNTPANDPFR
jgi:hypothetical protein